MSKSKDDSLIFNVFQHCIQTKASIQVIQKEQVWSACLLRLCNCITKQMLYEIVGVTLALPQDVEVRKGMTFLFNVYFRHKPSAKKAGLLLSVLESFSSSFKYHNLTGIQSALIQKFSTNYEKMESNSSIERTVVSMIAEFCDKMTILTTLSEEQSDITVQLVPGKLVEILNEYNQFGMIKKMESDTGHVGDFCITKGRQEAFRLFRENKVNVCVTGPSGSGKSSLFKAALSKGIIISLPPSGSIESVFYKVQPRKNELVVVPTPLVQAITTGKPALLKIMNTDLVWK